MLIIMRGPSCSGKSTLAISICNILEVNPNTTIISSDNFREMLTGDMSNQRQNKDTFEMLYSVMESRISNRVPRTIFDATNLRWKDIKRAVELCHKYGERYMVLSVDSSKTSVTELIRFNKERSDKGGLFVPETVFETHLKRDADNIEFVEKQVLADDLGAFYVCDRQGNIIDV